jgi:hypothetical protein
VLDDELIDQAISEDRNELARQMAAQERNLAQLAKDSSLVARANYRTEQLNAVARAHTNVAKAKIDLKTNPEDPAANLVLGRFMCMAEGDWDNGLPFLAKGGKGILQSAAQHELSGPSGPAADSTLADQWWDAAGSETGVAKRQVLSHAVHWYREALPQLSGLDRVKAEKRLGQAESLTARYAFDLLTGPCRIVLNNGLCLGIAHAATNPGAWAIIEPKANTADQEWTFETASAGYLQVANVNSGCMLEIYGGSANPGTNALQWIRTGGNGQLWKIEPIAGQLVRIVNKNSGLCLTAPGLVAEQNQILVQQPWTESANQLWRLEPTAH